jgi:hypothetical protein
MYTEEQLTAVHLWCKDKVSNYDEAVKDPRCIEAVIECFCGAYYSQADHAKEYCYSTALEAIKGLPFDPVVINWNDVAYQFEREGSFWYCWDEKTKKFYVFENG